MGVLVICVGVFVIYVGVLVICVGVLVICVGVLVICVGVLVICVCVLVICVGVFGNMYGYLGYMCWCLGIGRSQVPLTVRHIHNRLTSTPPGKIRTRYPSCRVAADLRLKSANMQQTKYHFLLYN